jgi:putative pyruvate formate lyase activating enzyme
MIDPEKYACTSDELARIMIELQEKRNCHNINFVSPSHFVPQIVESINKAIPLGLKIPLVYNSNGYDNLETLKHLDGIIDIYLPDLKYADNYLAKKYSGIPDYAETARAALKEMYRQVGLLKVDHQGVAQKGLIIRHLVLPNNISESKECLRWIAQELSAEVTLSLMAQYYPSNRAADYPELAYVLDIREYFDILQAMKDLGFTNALYQETRAALFYRPDFKNTDDPFH